MFFGDFGYNENKIKYQNLAYYHYVGGGSLPDDWLLTFILLILSYHKIWKLHTGCVSCIKRFSKQVSSE